MLGESFRPNNVSCGPAPTDDVAISSKKRRLVDCGEDEKLVEMGLSARKKSFTGLKAGESIAWA
jgi:hypothetical protein